MANEVKVQYVESSNMLESIVTEDWWEKEIKERIAIADEALIKRSY